MLLHCQKAGIWQDTSELDVSWCSGPQPESDRRIVSNGILHSLVRVDGTRWQMNQKEYETCSDLLG